MGQAAHANHGEVAACRPDVCEHPLRLLEGPPRRLLHRRHVDLGVLKLLWLGEAAVLIVLRIVGLLQPLAVLVYSFVVDLLVLVIVSVLEARGVRRLDVVNPEVVVVVVLLNVIELLLGV